MPRQQERRDYLTEIVLESASGRRIARISDIGPGGCFIDAITPVQPGEPVTFEVENGAGPLRFTGRVAYVLTGCGFGAEFTDLTDLHHQFIASRMA